MRYYPSLYCDEQVKFVENELKIAVIEKDGKVKKGKFSRTRRRRKVTLVLEIPIEEQEPVYMDVLTGEVFDIGTTLSNYPRRAYCTDAYVQTLSQDYLSKDNQKMSQKTILEILRAIHEEKKREWELNSYPICNMKDDGYDLLGYELKKSKTNPSSILTKELAQSILEEDVCTLRSIVENEYYMNVKDLYFATVKTTQEIVVLYPAVLRGYHNYVTSPDNLNLIGEYLPCDLSDITPFYSIYQENGWYPILTPSLAWTMVKDELRHNELKKQIK